MSITEWLTEQFFEQCFSLVFGKTAELSISKIKEQRDYRKKYDQVISAVNTILLSEQNNPYYDMLDKCISDSALITDCINEWFAGKKLEINQRILELCERNSDDFFYSQCVADVIIRILETIYQIILEPVSAEERRSALRVATVRNEVYESSNEIKREIDQIRLEIKEQNHISEQQRYTFEEKIISQYLAGNLIVLKDTLLEIDSWCNVPLPNEIQPIIDFLHIAAQFYESGSFSLDDIRNFYISDSQTPFDSLLLALVFCFAGKEFINQVRDEIYDKSRWKRYDRFLSYIKQEEIPDNPFILNDDSRNLIVALCLVKNNDKAHLNSQSYHFPAAKAVLPASLVDFYSHLNSFAFYEWKYTGIAPTERMYDFCESEYQKIEQLSAFFEQSVSLRQMFFEKISNILAHCRDAFITSHIHNNKGLLEPIKTRIPLQLRLWHKGVNILSPENYTVLLDECLSNSEQHIQLIGSAIDLYSHEYVCQYLLDRKYLLRKNILYLLLACRAGCNIDLSEYRTNFENNSLFYCLCDEKQSMSTHEAQEKVFECIKTNGVIPLIHPERILTEAIKNNRMAELENILGQEMPVILWRIRAKVYLDYHLRGKAYACITRVVDSLAVIGEDYAVLGMSSTSNREQKEVFERGYREYKDITCMYNLLSLQHKHNEVDPELVNKLSFVDNVAVQFLISDCFKTMGEQNKALLHATRALLLCEEENKNLFFHFLILSSGYRSSDEVRNITSDSYVVLRDEDGDSTTLCFYAQKDLLPRTGSNFAHASHHMGNLNSSVFPIFAGRTVNQVVKYQNRQYTICEIGLSLAFLFRHCMNTLVACHSVRMLQGTPEELLRKLTDLTEKSDKSSELLINNYTHNVNGHIGYRTFAKRFGCSYILAMYKLVCNDKPLRGVLVSESVNDEKIVIGLDTIFLLSQLPLSDTEMTNICKHLIISESACGQFQNEYLNDMTNQALTTATFFVDNGEPVFVEHDRSDPYGGIRTFYEPVHRIVDRIQREKAIFECPQTLFDKQDQITYLFGQDLLDNAQLALNGYSLCLNDNMSYNIVQSIFGRRIKLASIMNVLAVADLSIDTMLNCLDKMAQMRFYGVINPQFLFSLCTKLRTVKAEGKAEEYEHYLSRIIDVFALIREKGDPFENDFRNIFEEINESGFIDDDLMQIVFQMILFALPDDKIASILTDSE